MNLVKPFCPAPRTLISSAALMLSCGSLQAAETAVSLNSNVGIAVAAISGAALVTAIWAMLLGRQSMKKDRDFVTTLKKNIVRDQRSIDKAMRMIQTSEERAAKAVDKLVYQNNALTSKQHQAWMSAEKIQDLSEHAEEIEADLQRRSEALERRIEQAQHVWNERLNETESTVLRVEQELRDGLNHLETGIKRVQQQDAHSYQLAQHITAQHNLQLQNLEMNNELSERVRNNLNTTLKESTHLLDHLRKHQGKAEDAYQKYMGSIEQYEDDLFTEYDSAYQNADMARQELDANIDESRLHLETIRRYETQSRHIKEQTENNLKQLDVKTINQLADTLDTTQKTFQSLSNKVAEAHQALNKLNRMDLNQTGENQGTERHFMQKAVGDTNTLIPFFSSRKPKETDKS